MFHPTPRPTFFPYTTLFRSVSTLTIGVSRTVSRTAISTGITITVTCSRPHRSSADAATITISRQDQAANRRTRSEEHTSELQSRGHLVCRLLLEKKKAHMII